MSGEIFNVSDTDGKHTDSNRLNLLQVMPEAHNISTPAKVTLGLGLGFGLASAYLLLHGRGGASAESTLVERLDAFGRQLNELVETGKSPYITGPSHVSAEFVKPFNSYYGPLAEAWAGRAALESHLYYARLGREHLRGTELGPIPYALSGKVPANGWVPFVMPSKSFAYDLSERMAVVGL
jgi:hypothetical protein